MRKGIFPQKCTKGKKCPKNHRQNHLQSWYLSKKSLHKYALKTKKFTKSYAFMQDFVNNGAIDRN